MNDFYLKLLAIIEILIDLDPEPNTPEGIVLAGLSQAVQAYEEAMQMAVRTRIEL